MKVSEMIKKLQDIEREHGDLEIYEHTDWATITRFESVYRPEVAKIYYQNWEDASHMRNELSDGRLDVADADLYDVDLSKPIVKGVII
ncbi:hypothetical protein [Oceanobacillus sp. FSL H7-0719]|uniref:hypothetical protein n=1 Tax=Oceanobacillus sp. FSL H7-0719 TaxID=2954507 RepID=UPI003243D815